MWKASESGNDYIFAEGRPLTDSLKQNKNVGTTRDQLVSKLTTHN